MNERIKFFQEKATAFLKKQPMTRGFFAG